MSKSEIPRNRIEAAKWNGRPTRPASDNPREYRREQRESAERAWKTETLRDERAGVPDVANPKKGMQDEFHRVRESPLKQEECSLWMEGAPCIPENSDTEFSTPRHVLVRMPTAGRRAGPVGRAGYS